MLENVNATALSPELLMAALVAIDEMPPEDRPDMTARMMVVISTLQREAPEADRAGLAMAVNFRLTALAHLMTSERLAGFKQPGGLDYELISEDVVRTAAVVPLRMIDDELSFDPHQFRDHLLSIASPAGKA